MDGATSLLSILTTNHLETHDTNKATICQQFFNLYH